MTCSFVFLIEIVQVMLSFGKCWVFLVGPLQVASFFDLIFFSCALSHVIFFETRAKHETFCINLLAHIDPENMIIKKN